MTIPGGHTRIHRDQLQLVESAGHVTITVAHQRQHGAVTVGYQTKTVTPMLPVCNAIGGRDYTATNGTLTFGPG